MTKAILGTVQPMIVIKPGQTLSSSIINEALQSNDEFPYHWKDNPLSMLYEGVTDMRIKLPLRQHQQLENIGKHLYKILTHKVQKTGTHIH